jgi:hypothetical protein
MYEISQHMGESLVSGLAEGVEVAEEEGEEVQVQLVQTAQQVLQEQQGLQELQDQHLEFTIHFFSKVQETSQLEMQVVKICITLDCSHLLEN